MVDASSAEVHPDVFDRIPEADRSGLGIPPMLEELTRSERRGSAEASALQSGF